ncbi:MAG TPA: hypothetical protein PLE19_22955 [Planctomycetota bacterium]|nr:hypothetical protein [Planctomycetota bacterium]HRR82516.1 hypothetical protein [Planctomycetota bacterium]HRT97715.1 hypothetical protein [Planctomycetota bacterium]
MAARVEGKVAKILDDQTLILNVGTSAGVAAGMVFSVFAPVEDVKDPDTGKSLGAWEAVKGYVQAAHPQEHLTVCRVYVPQARGESRPEDRGTHVLSAEMVEVSMLRGGSQPKARLNVDRTQLSGLPEVGPIRVGDRVRSVDEAEIKA